MADFDIDSLLDASLTKKDGAAPANGNQVASPTSEDKKRANSTDRDDHDSKKRRRSNSPSNNNDRDRDRDRRDRDVDRDRRDRDRDRDYRDRDRDRDYRDRDRGGRDYRDRDYRSRDRDRDYRDRDRDRDYRGGGRSSPGRDARDKDRDWERDRRVAREERDRREREMTAKDREALEAERDSRTVFAINLPIKATERQLWDFFDKVGKVQDIRLISDRNSRKSKGFGYIEFKERESVQAALSSSGTVFMGQSIIIQVTQAEKNRVVNTSSSTTAAAGPTRLYVGSLHFNISEDDLRSVFAPFGDIEFINLHMDTETNRSKGFGFVQFKRAEDAKRALQQVNGLEIAGRQIKVGLVNESNNAVGPGGVVGGGGHLGELDDDDGGGLSLNAQTRADLMAKLQRGAAPGGGIATLTPTAMPIIPTLSAPAYNPFVATGAVPTPFVLLKNMFDPTLESDPNFDAEIKDDVLEECTKHGPVIHIFVDKESQGHVYLKFASIDGATKASQALQGRWFAGKMITAEFYPESTYYFKFPEARRG